MKKPNQKAIEVAERLLRLLRTGEMSGFIAIATDEDDVASTHAGGRMNLTQTVCLLEDMKLRILGEWMENFTTSNGPVLEVMSKGPED